MYQATTPCPKCGAQNLRGTWVCNRCGNTLLVYCHACRAGNVSGSKFCQSCGQSLSPTGATTPPAQHTPQYASQQPHDIRQGGYPPQDYSQQQQQYQQYQGGYPPPYEYQPAGQGGGDIVSRMQGFFDRAQGSLNDFPAKLKQFVSATNPILLSSLVILIVGLGVFLLLAFQLGWIKSTEAAKPTMVKNTTPPAVLTVDVKEGASRNTAIIYWVTDKPSSSQVKYGPWPYANTLTPIQNDPTKGTNAGVLVHEVGLINLIGGTTYVYQCISVDKDGNKVITPESQFQTTK